MARRKAVQNRQPVSSDSSEDEDVIVKKVKFEKKMMPVPTSRPTKVEAESSESEEDEGSSESDGSDRSDDSEEDDEEQEEGEEEDNSNSDEEQEQEKSAAPLKSVVPFFKPALRQAAFNYVVPKEDGDEDEVDDERGEYDIDYAVEMYALTSGTLDIEDAPKPFEEEMSFKLPRYSHLYSIEPKIEDEDTGDAINQLRKVLLGKYPMDKVPMVYVYEKKGKEASKAILLQFLDIESHRNHYSKLHNLEFSMPDQEEDTSTATYKLTRIHSGLRVDPRVCTVTFKAVFAPSESLLPIGHDVAVRVAIEFAKRYGGKAPLEEYPEQAEGVLQVWRNTLEEYNLEGQEVISDLNEFQMSFWMPDPARRRRFVPYFDEDVTKRKFCFDFAGQSKFCNICKDNSKHTEADCTRKPESEWTAQCTSSYL